MKLNKEDYRAANADNLTCSINEQVAYKYLMKTFKLS